jgi:tetratricopeptide (TPR) repeat protein
MTVVVQPAGGVTKGQKSAVSVSQPKDSSYWFQKGALCSTYGNNRAAVAYFEKAIALDPNHSGAYFSQGVSYGQLGEYARAISSIDRAIQMEPRNGLYYYGRGRVYLLSGEKEKAMQDFRKAADLGDEDAHAYLQKIQ